MTTTILALDLGTTTGWALRSSDGAITSGSESFRPQRFEGGGMRFLRFKRWLAELKDMAGGIDALHFEEVRRHVSTDAAHVYGGFLATLTAWCEHHQMPYQGRHDQEARHRQRQRIQGRRIERDARTRPCARRRQRSRRAGAAALGHRQPGGLR